MSDPIFHELSVDQFRQTLRLRLREIKVPVFHQQHLVLVDYITDLYGCIRELQRHAPTEADKQQLTRVLNQFRDYTLQHFREEEEYLQKIQFIGLQQQINAHRKFVAALTDMERRVWHDSIAHILDLLHLTIGWLFDHINTIDILYSRAAEGEVIDADRLKIVSKRPSVTSVTPGHGAAGGTLPLSEQSMIRALKGRLRDVGVPRFNQEHQQLLNQIMHLYETIHSARNRTASAADWDQIAGLFNFLHRYTQAHFRGEEEMMQQRHYPHYDQHRQHHQQLSSRLAELYRRFQSDKTIAVAMDLLFFLIDWLMNHINTVDFQYKSDLKGEGI
ncbi:MAG: bacteriohemerythrin [Magnetococcales bacterium]|nr:bacteriohemerythrin [Magnetococcales bacterium]